MAASTRSRVFVHLGDHGSPKSGDFPHRFRTAQFIEIDPKHEPVSSRNLRRVRADSLSGLASLPNGSARLVSSEMCFGYYSSTPVGIRMPGYEDYTRDTARAVFAKLEPGGKFVVVVGSDALELARGAIKSAGFKDELVQVSPLPKSASARTDWMGEFSERKKIALYQIVAQKPDADSSPVELRAPATRAAAETHKPKPVPLWQRILSLRFSQ